MISIKRKSIGDVIGDVVIYTLLTILAIIEACSRGREEARIRGVPSEFLPSAGDSPNGAGPVGDPEF